MSEQEQTPQDCRDCGKVHLTTRSALLCDHRMGKHQERHIGCPECDAGNWGQK
jgi:hypothetical protein